MVNNWTTAISEICRNRPCHCYITEAQPAECVKKWSRQDSNLDLEFRKLLFYPLNYGTFSLFAGKFKKPCSA